MKSEKYIIETELTIRAQTNLIYKICHKIESSKWFGLFSMMIILSNAVILALTKYPDDKSMDQILKNCNLAFFFYFVVELFIKITGRGFKYYFREKFNWFDSAVVIFSTIDVAL